MKVYAVVVGHTFDDNLIFSSEPEAAKCLRYTRERLKIADNDLTVRITAWKVHRRFKKPKIEPAKDETTEDNPKQSQVGETK